MRAVSISFAAVAAVAVNAVVVFACLKITAIQQFNFVVLCCWR